MKLEISIDSENEACKTRAGVLEILDGVQNRLRFASAGSTFKILDVNGNAVGTFCISEEDEE